MSRAPLFRFKVAPPGATVAALGFIAHLTACTTLGPAFTPVHVDGPAAWPQQAITGDDGREPGFVASPIPADRWSVFHDPVLLQLQQQALGSSLDVKAAAIRLIQSRVNETTVSAQRGPRLDARAAAAEQRLSESGAATRVAGALGGAAQQQLIDALSKPFALYQAGFDASWEPDLWGRVARSEEAARAYSDGQVALLQNVRLSLLAEVARQYFQMRAAHDQIAYVGKELAVSLDLLGVLAAQRNGGMTDESPLIRQRGVVAELEALLPNLRAQEAQARNQIALLCGARPGNLQDLFPGDAPVAEPVQLPDLGPGLPSEVVRNRPDLRAAEAALHAATANIGLAMADLYPRITLGASFGIESVSSGKFGEWGSRQWTLGPSLSIPVFDQGRRQSIVVLREMQQQESAIAYQQAVLKAWQEVDDAIGNYAAEKRRGGLLVQKFRLTEEEAALARARYSNGLTNHVAVSNAEVALLEANRAIADSHWRQRFALTALYKALGTDGDIDSKDGKPLQ